MASDFSWPFSSLRQSHVWEIEGFLLLPNPALSTVRSRSCPVRPVLLGAFTEHSRGEPAWLSNYHSPHVSPTRLTVPVAFLGSCNQLTRITLLPASGGPQPPSFLTWGPSTKGAGTSLWPNHKDRLHFLKAKSQAV